MSEKGEGEAVLKKKGKLPTIQVWLDDVIGKVSNTMRYRLTKNPKTQDFHRKVTEMTFENTKQVPQWLGCSERDSKHTTSNLDSQERWSSTYLDSTQIPKIRAEMVQCPTRQRQATGESKTMACTYYTIHTHGTKKARKITRSRS